MFGNGTLVDLLRFDKVVQARTKVPSKGPDRRAGDWNRRSGTSLGSIGAAQAHLRAHAHLASPARSPAPAVRKLETLKHIFDRRATGARKLRAPVRALNYPTRVSARVAEVYLRRFSSWKWAIEPSFSSYSDLEETWSSIRGGLGLCLIFAASRSINLLWML